MANGGPGIKRMAKLAAIGNEPVRNTVNSFLTETSCGPCGRPLQFDPEQQSVYWIEVDRSITCDDCHKRSLTGDDGAA